MLLCATPWVDLEDIMLKEMSVKNTYTQTLKLNKNKRTELLEK